MSQYLSFKKEFGWSEIIYKGDGDRAINIRCKVKISVFEIHPEPMKDRLFLYREIPAQLDPISRSTKLQFTATLVLPLVSNLATPICDHLQHTIEVFSGYMFQLYFLTHYKTNHTKTFTVFVQLSPHAAENVITADISLNDPPPPTSPE